VTGGPPSVSRIAGNPANWPPFASGLRGSALWPTRVPRLPAGRIDGFPTEVYDPGRSGWVSLTPGPTAFVEPSGRRADSTSLNPMPDLGADNHDSGTFPEVHPNDLRGGVILLVDDNPQNLELMQAYLESLPCEIRTARDGLEAVRSIEEEQPDLILLDVMMPRMSGFEVCQKIKSNPRTRDIVVIMVTALHEIGDYERAHESGTDDFLSKPVNKLELLIRVKSLLRVRMLKKQLEALRRQLGVAEPDDVAVSDDAIK